MSVEEKSAVFYASLLEVGVDPSWSIGLFNLLSNLGREEGEEASLCIVGDLFEFDDPKARNHNGQTALHILSRNGRKFDLKRWTRKKRQCEHPRILMGNPRFSKPRNLEESVYRLLHQALADPFLGYPTRPSILSSLLRSLRSDSVYDALRAFTQLMVVTRMCMMKAGWQPNST